MKRLAALLPALAAACGLALPAKAAPLVDCPLRDAPFSAASPLIDLLLSPAAKAVIERETETSFAGLPPMFAGTEPPTFAAILTYREAALGFMGQKPDSVERIDAALRKLPVTPADKVARCARYDTVPPRLAIPQAKVRLLLFEKINGFRDGPSVDAAHARFVALAEANGWGLVTTDKGSAFTPAILRQFDAVIWNNVSGDVLTLGQRRAFQDYMAAGGGYVGVHGSAGDPVYFWDWYADTLLGARFAGHTMDPQIQDATVRLETAGDRLARGLPGSWVMKDEWYSFRTNPRAAGARILATLDEGTYKPEGMGRNLRMGDHPIAWSKCVGKGRMFYSAIGHSPETYSDPRYRTMLTNAVAWAASGGACRPGR